MTQILILMNFGFYILQIGLLEAKMQKTVIPSVMFHHIEKMFFVSRFLVGRFAKFENLNSLELNSE